MSNIFIYSRSRLRNTPIRSSEDIEMERIAKEKNEMRSLKKMNEEGLKNIVLSAGKSSPAHKMVTRSTEQVCTYYTNRHLSCKS